MTPKEAAIFKISVRFYLKEEIFSVYCFNVAGNTVTFTEGGEVSRGGNEHDFPETTGFFLPEPGSLFPGTDTGSNDRG